MKVIAQLIVDGTIIQQTMPVDSEYTHDSLSWKLRFDCEMLVAPLNHDSTTYALQKHTTRADLPDSRHT
jgi:hypothetical protein